jgi:hypothetical protein
MGISMFGMSPVVFQAQPPDQTLSQTGSNMNRNGYKYDVDMA